MKLWDRIQQGMDAGFDASLSAVHAITEKVVHHIDAFFVQKVATDDA